MKLSKKKLKSLIIETTESGFTVWIYEKVSNGRVLKHWLIDGSLVKENGRIQLGNAECRYRYTVRYDKKERTIIFFDKKENYDKNKNC